MDIRILQPEDWMLWKALRLEAIVHNSESFGSSLEEEQNCPDEQFKLWLRNSTIFGAFIDHRLIGTTGFFVFGATKERHRGMLFSVYVSPLYRNHGIAHHLVAQTIEQARDKVIQLHLKVVSTNETAIGIYEHYGFKIYGTEPRSLKINDHFLDEHLMVLSFDTPSREM